MSNPLTPSSSVLSKLASFVVHVDEYNSPQGHPFDLAAVKSLLEDHELNEWISDMRQYGFVPMKR